MAGRPRDSFSSSTYRVLIASLDSKEAGEALDVRGRDTGQLVHVLVNQVRTQTALSCTKRGEKSQDESVDNNDTAALHW